MTASQPARLPKVQTLGSASLHAAIGLVLALSSSIVPVRIGLAIIQRELDGQTPNPLADLSEKNAVCIEAQWLKTKGLPKCRLEGIKIYCEDTWIKTKTTPEIRCDITGKVQKSAPLTLTGRGPTVRLTVPVSASVTAKALVQETVTAGADLFADITPKLANDWSLTALIEPDFRWSQRPELRLFNFVRVTVASKAEPEVRKALEKFATHAQKELARIEFRRTVEAVWRDVQRPIALSNSPPAYAAFEPTAAYFTGLDVRDNVLHTTIGLSGHTRVILGEPPQAPRLRPLPPLTAEAPSPGEFVVGLPASAGYQDLQDIANKQFPTGHTLELDTQGKLRVHVSNLRVKRADDGRLSLALAVVVDSRPAWVRALDIFDWFPVKGDFTFVGTPRIEPTTRAFTVDKLTYDAETNKSIVNALVDVANIEPIRRYMQSLVRYDFGPALDASVKRANAELAKLSRGNINIVAALTAAELRSVALSDVGVTVWGRAAGRVSVDVGL
jgi:hypothetical protein